MSSIVIDAFLIDDDNAEKFWQHGILPEQVIDVLSFPHLVRRNRKERLASHLIIGRDEHGRCLAIPIEPTNDPALWRPITAWNCKPSERSLLPK